MPITPRGARFKLVSGTGKKYVEGLGFCIFRLSTIDIGSFSSHGNECLIPFFPKGLSGEYSPGPGEVFLELLLLVRLFFTLMSVMGDFFFTTSSFGE